ncbi:aspartate kinase [candidate division KSB1 bacterium]|nr:aspartate kinase [candidate division KSB1 bacterium]
MNRIIVEKYGGSSVGSVDRMKAIAANVVTRHSLGYKMVIVVSAMGDTTDDLISLMNQIAVSPRHREMSMLLSTGEMVSSALLSMAIQALGKSATSLTGPQGGIHADSVHTEAKISSIDTRRILELLERDEIIVMAGYQGKVGDDITVLGRGGSDASAVALAAALGADQCNIYTDVNGVYSADPRVVPDASLLDCISYEEMIELAGSGARVMMGRAVEIARKYNLDVLVKSSFDESSGTLITREDALEKVVITGVAANTDVAKISIYGLHRNAHAILRCVAGLNVNIRLLTVNEMPNHETNLSIIVHPDEVMPIRQKLDELKRSEQIKSYAINTDVAKVSIVGSGIATHSGVAFDMFDCLAEAGIDVFMTSTSEIKISAIIPKHAANDAVRALHTTFKLNTIKRKLAEA